MFSWPWPKRKKPVIISRDELRMLISRQCGDQEFVPLDMNYRLVPSHRWLVGKTPIFPRWMKDCNKRAGLTMSKMLKHCVGMCVITTNNPMITHTLCIVCMEDKQIMLYDPSQHTLSSPKYHDIIRKWL